MFAIFDLHFKRPVVMASLAAELAPPTNIATVLSESVVQFDPAVAANILYASMSPSNICLIFPISSKSLQVHVEARRANGSVAELKKESTVVHRAFQDACKQSRQKIKASSVSIYAEDNRITEGRPEGLFLGAWRRVRERIYYDIALALTPIPMGLIFERPIAESAWTAGAVAVALLIVLLVESARHRGDVNYEDV